MTNKMKAATHLLFDHDGTTIKGHDLEELKLCTGLDIWVLRYTYVEESWLAGKRLPERPFSLNKSTLAASSTKPTGALASIETSTSSNDSGPSDFALAFAAVFKPRETELKENRGGEVKQIAKTSLVRISYF